MVYYTCSKLAAGKSWSAIFDSFLTPIYYVYGWTDITDKTSRADLLITFDSGVTWAAFAQDFFEPNIPWPTFKGYIFHPASQNSVSLGCVGVKLIVVTASK